MLFICLILHLFSFFIVFFLFFLFPLKIITILNYLGKQTVNFVRSLALMIAWVVKMLMIDIFSIKNVFFLDIEQFDL